MGLKNRAQLNWKYYYGIWHKNKGDSAANAGMNRWKREAGLERALEADKRKLMVALSAIFVSEQTLRNLADGGWIAFGDGVTIARNEVANLQEAIKRIEG